MLDPGKKTTSLRIAERGINVLPSVMQIDILFAQGEGGGISQMLIMMLPIFVLFYLLFIRPQPFTAPALAGSNNRGQRVWSS